MKIVNFTVLTAWLCGFTVAMVLVACHSNSDATPPAGPSICDRQLELCQQDLAICKLGQQRTKNE